MSEDKNQVLARAEDMLKMGYSVADVRRSVSNSLADQHSQGEINLVVADAALNIAEGKKTKLNPFTRKWTPPRR